MNMNKEDALKRLDNLEAEASALRAIIDAPDEGEQWVPRGKWYVRESGEVLKGYGGWDLVEDFGNYFLTEEMAEKAAIAMRKHNRILAYVLEHAPDYTPDWENFHDIKWFVLYNFETGDWEMDWNAGNCLPGVTYMPEDVATQLRKDIKSGRVVL
jgi:hypothetical protein